MQVDIGQLIEILKNIAAVGIIVYWSIDSIRSWVTRKQESPELKILKEDLQQTHQDLRALIAKL